MKYFTIPVGILIGILLAMMIVTFAQAQRTTQGMLINFDFGLLEAPSVLGVAPRNLRCRIMQRYKYECFDINSPDSVVPFDTIPNRNTNENSS